MAHTSLPPMCVSASLLYSKATDFSKQGACKHKRLEASLGYGLRQGKAVTEMTCPSPGNMKELQARVPGSNFSSTMERKLCDIPQLIAQGLVSPSPPEVLDACTD